MSLWLTLKRREHPRSFLPPLEKRAEAMPVREAAVRAARRRKHRAGKAERGEPCARRS